MAWKTFTKKDGTIHHFTAGDLSSTKWAMFKFAKCNKLPEGRTYGKSLKHVFSFRENEGWGPHISNFGYTTHLGIAVLLPGPAEENLYLVLELCAAGHLFAYIRP